MSGAAEIDTLIHPRAFGPIPRLQRPSLERSKPCRRRTNRTGAVADTTNNSPCNARPVTSDDNSRDNGDSRPQPCAIGHREKPLETTV